MVDNEPVGIHRFIFDLYFVSCFAAFDSFTPRFQHIDFANLLYTNKMFLGAERHFRVRKDTI